MSNRFTAIPEVPIGITDSQTLLIAAVKENIELLTGFRNEDDRISKSVTKGDITVSQMSIQRMQQISAKGKGFTISNEDVVSLEDYAKLLTDVQELANDLAYTRAVLNALINQIKG